VSLLKHGRVPRHVKWTKHYPRRGEEPEAALAKEIAARETKVAEHEAELAEDAAAHGAKPVAKPKAGGGTKKETKEPKVDKAPKAEKAPAPKKKEAAKPESKATESPKAKAKQGAPAKAEDKDDGGAKQEKAEAKSS
jgi:hypothetical protein